METIFTTAYLLPLLVSLAASLVIIPVLVRFSHHLGLVDKPDHRKLHTTSIPAVGGIAILAAVILAVFFSVPSLVFIGQQPVLIISSVLLMITGVLDDRMNIRPLYRLLIQMVCSLALAASGIRLTSLYGFLGMGEIGLLWQYVLTILVITGATNAFNLIDGIDGLAGGLAIINITVMAVISIQTGKMALLSLLLVVAGGLLGFLKNNFNPARVFMGDGGSLMLGFFTAGTGIYLIETAKQTASPDLNGIVVIIAALLAVPVFDSLRVYLWRMRRGESPFKADRTHLHHLLLIFGISHKKTTLLIYLLEIIIVTTGFFFRNIATISLTVLLMTMIFMAVGYLLQLNSEVEKWLGRIRSMESETE